ncbi:TPA: DUF551 domain-containing protein [Klebsiella pneumoniae]|nr:DUF551 domain-containing protein [Klebsiella pneumoniae]HBT0452718.1 DUF551 domain-containing protein [Klebsiella pneumoniae]HBX4431512.1 DUF551 domain-containing protein [Klebsiella pneumoniae]
MTINQLNRERLEKIKSWRETYGAGSNVMLPAEEAEELARIALAAMDSKPVAPVAEIVSIYGDPEAFGEREIRPLVGIQQMPYGTKLYRHAQPALVIPDEMTAEQAYEIGYYYGDPVNVFARGANWMRQHIIDSTLAAAQHDTPTLNSVQSVLTVPGKWIPVSERMPIEFEAVIAFDGDQVYGEAMYSSDDGFTIDGYEPCDRLNLQNVTHWMPMPTAPQEVK